MGIQALILPLAIVALASYLLGSLNTAIFVSRFVAGDDIRKHGSGNAGMTNILRTYGKGPAVATALGDFAKAVVSVLLGRLVFYLFGVPPEFPLDAGYIAGMFVLLGHILPLYFRFRGGKGVMTCLGVIFMTNPVVFLIIAAVFVPLVFVVRIVSVGSVLGAVAYPVVTHLVLRFTGREPRYDTICAILISALILYMHRENIVRLLQGKENKFERKK